jgi:carboxylesterase type B
MNFTDAGKHVATSMATYWTNFAKSHDPNQPVSKPVTWSPASPDEPYLYFQDPLDVRKDYLKDDCDFWDKIGYKANLFSL